MPRYWFYEEVFRMMEGVPPHARRAAHVEPFESPRRTRRTWRFDLRERAIVFLAVCVLIALVAPERWVVVLNTLAFFVLLFPALKPVPPPAVRVIPPPPTAMARDYCGYDNFVDPMLRAAAAEATVPENVGVRRADTIRWMGYADQELARLRQALGLPVAPSYATGRPQYHGGLEKS